MDIHSLPRRPAALDEADDGRERRAEERAGVVADDDVEVVRDEGAELARLVGRDQGHDPRDLLGPERRAVVVERRPAAAVEAVEHLVEQRVARRRLAPELEPHGLLEAAGPQRGGGVLAGGVDGVGLVRVEAVARGRRGAVRRALPERVDGAARVREAPPRRGAVQHLVRGEDEVDVALRAAPRPLVLLGRRVVRPFGGRAGDGHGRGPRELRDPRVDEGPDARSVSLELVVRAGDDLEVHAAPAAPRAAAAEAAPRR